MTYDQRHHDGGRLTLPPTSMQTRGPSARRRHAITVAALTGVTALGLAACGSSSSSSTTTTQRPTTTTTKPSSSTTATTRAATSTTTKPASTGCPTSMLDVTLGDPNGTAGAIHYTLTFHNAGSSSCTLYGYPGVSFLASGGAEIGAPAVRSGGSATPVTVAAGGNAYSSVAVTDPGIPPCSGQSTATQVRVYPPGQTQAAVVAAPSGVDVCSSPNTSAYQSAQVTAVSATQL